MPVVECRVYNASIRSLKRGKKSSRGFSMIVNIYLNREKDAFSGRFNVSLIFFR